MMAEPMLLVVDDDPIARRMTRAILEARGYQVREADGGAAALSTLDDVHPALFVLDYQMPGMDGPTFARRVRADHPDRGTPIVMLTASDGPDAIDAAFAAGADDYILKPVNPRLLIARVDAALRAAADRARVLAASAVARAHATIASDLEEAALVQAAQRPTLPTRCGAVDVDGAVVSLGAIGGDTIALGTALGGAPIVGLIDVSGHGAAAALVAASTATELRMLAETRPLGEAVRELGMRMLAADTGRYACLGIAVVTGRIAQIVNAGLPPIAIVRGGEIVQTIGTTAMPVGLIGGSPVDVETVVLEPGDRVVLLSDGLTEPFGRADAIGPAIQSLVLAPASGPRGLDARIRGFLQGSGAEDDATMVVLTIPG